MFESVSIMPYSHWFPYIGAVVYVYYFPTFVALLFNTRSLGEILFANTLIGWSILGWFGCLVWALEG